MNWEEAQESINNRLTRNLHLTDSRIITEIPPYYCRKFQYNETGYSVQIGVNNSLDIPLTMLKTIFNDAINQPNRIYNNRIFKIHYGHQAKIHGCHVHVIGKMFELSGVAKNINARNYVIL